jgi:hypothetical protein
MRLMLCVVLFFSCFPGMPAIAAEGRQAASWWTYDMDFGRTAAGWKAQPLSRLKRDTVYPLAQEGGDARA